MDRVTRVVRRLQKDECGHAAVGASAAAAAIGAIVLGIGAATGEDIVTIIGAIVLAVSVFLVGLGEHVGVDYDIFRRLENLEK